MDNLLLIASIIFIVVIAGWLNFRLDKRSHKSKKTYAYRRKNYLMTRNERDFFRVLQENFGDNCYIFPQIHLSAILDERIKNGQNWKAAFRHINGKSVDFVLCERRSLKPLVAIELDDKSHEKEKRRTRDAEVERIFKQAELPLIRFTYEEAINNEFIREKISERLHS